MLVVTLWRFDGCVCAMRVRKQTLGSCSTHSKYEIAKFNHVYNLTRDISRSIYKSLGITGVTNDVIFVLKAYKQCKCVHYLRYLTA